MVETSRINKMNQEINTKLEEQERNRIVLIELLPDDEYTSYSSFDSIKVPNLNVRSDHKHYIINANNQNTNQLLDQKF